MSDHNLTQSPSSQSLTQLGPDDIRLGSNYYTNLSPAAVVYLDRIISEFARDMVYKAEMIAKAKQVKGTPLEIIPQHLEDARLIMQVKKTPQGKLLPILRLLVFALPILTGVTGSYLTTLWVRPLFSALLVASLVFYFFNETESRREI